MLCQKCEKEQATTYIKTIINGKLSEFSICSDCAQAMGYGKLLPEFNFSSFFKNFSNNEPEYTNSCPMCGMTFPEIINSGRVGCSTCYSKFQDKLLPSIRRIHGTAQHKGKIPGKSALLVSPQKTQLSVLQADPVDSKRRLLKKAIEEQRFEDAAILRDQIRELEK